MLRPPWPRWRPSSELAATASWTSTGAQAATVASWSAGRVRATRAVHRRLPQPHGAAEGRGPGLRLPPPHRRGRVLGDKDARGILAALEPVLDDVVITEVQSPRALPVDVLAEYARDAFGEERVHVAEQLPTAVETAIQLAEDDSDGMLAGAGVLVTGSVVTAGEARTLFAKKPE